MSPRVLAERLAAVSGRRMNSDGAGGFLVCCPAHADEKPSLHISAGKNHVVAMCCLAGCQTDAVLAAADLSWREIGDHDEPVIEREEYPYCDENGELLYVIVRRGHGKGRKFSSYSYTPNGTIVHNAKGVHRVLYRLPEVIAAVDHGDPIYLCEGEKDVEAMRRRYGVTATTNAFGAVAWASDCERFDYGRFLRGACVIVIQDRDAIGVRRTRQIVQSIGAVVNSLAVVEAAHGKDAFDHIAAELNLNDFVPIEASEQPLTDDGRFVPVPAIFLDAIATLNLSHLEYRVLMAVVHLSARRDKRGAAWRSVTCSSVYVARQCGNASPAAVRTALLRLRQAGILLDDLSSGEASRAGHAREARVNADYAAWKPLEHRQTTTGRTLKGQPLCSASTAIQE